MKRAVVKRLDGIYEIIITRDYIESDFIPNFHVKMFCRDGAKIRDCKMDTIVKGIIYFKEVSFENTCGL